MRRNGRLVCHEDYNINLYMDIICNFKRDEGRSSAFGVQALITNHFVLPFKTHQNQDVKQILG
ncbi:hypothetical protein FDF36_15085 [Bacteroides fragilis]|uniref:Uncharacterized protein n=1 Tax=Bacteroides fragilis TaxID=817 RepID=A0A413K3N1_BACFG|nr:hypothetical protein [Bacteroides fragilis]RGY70658.1 hypothetical protein DXA27_04540 [Bacteroides fragilis]